MDTLRVFIRFCESIDAVEQDLNTKVVSPTLSSGDNERDVMLDADVATRILDHQDRYEYATTNHVVMTLMWHTMMRRGAVRALDVEDYNSDEESLQVRHRPSTGTPLKNKEDGERYVALSPDVCRLLDDYLSTNRDDVEDDHGRRPLVTTTHGRPHELTIMSWTYGMTRPCTVTGECPHDRDIDDCDAARRVNDASKCPSSVSPHAVRRGGITHWLSSDVPKEVVSDRANVGSDVIDQHYDRRTEREKMEQRRRWLDSV